MNTKIVMNGTLFTLFLITSFCIPVSAYSADATNLYSSARNLTESGNYTEAVAAYNNAITLEPMYFEAWNGLADALNRNGQFNEALAASNRSLEINPDFVKGWINRGQILYNIGYSYEDVAHNMVAADNLYVEQLTAFEKAISLDPNNAEAWFNKGYALAGMQRYDEAIAAFDQVKVLDPSYPNLQKNREIAVQLRNKAVGSPVTTGSVGQAPASKTTSPESPGQLPTGTSPQPSSINDVAGVIAVLCAGFFVLRRK
ncbi:MAG: tetratricopeptide repeat protein [Methanoregula sp.]|jgi:tetratricopeptide (TPR) repeat protein